MGSTSPRYCGRRSLIGVRSMKDPRRPIWSQFPVSMMTATSSPRVVQRLIRFIHGHLGEHAVSAGSPLRFTLSQAQAEGVILAAGRKLPEICGTSQNDRSPFLIPSPGIARVNKRTSEERARIKSSVVLRLLDNLADLGIYPSKYARITEERKTHALKTANKVH